MAVVVGIDGSEGSHRALRWAVGEARLRRSAVRMIHAWTFPEGIRGKDGLPHADLQTAAAKVLEEAVGAVPDPGGVEINGEVSNDDAADALIAASEDAEMVVVGSKGLSGIAGALLGSVSRKVAHEAKCPVVIIPGTERERAG